MASEEERAKIMAEYMASANNDDEEEEEDFEDESDGDNNAPNYPVLHGRLKLNADTNQLVYVGLWCMKVNEGKGRDPKTKFKLKSKKPMSKDFNLAKPIDDDKSSFTVTLNGYFTTDHTDTVKAHRKIEENDVEITITRKRRGGDDKYDVNGKGNNAFGFFTLEGTYTPDVKNTGDDVKHSMVCKKTYGGGETYNSEGSDEDSGDDKADIGELLELQGDAQMSIEDLKKKYYGGGEEDDDTRKQPASKKARTEPAAPPPPADDDDDDDDECGF